MSLAAPLQELDLQVTGICDLRCGFCSVGARPGGHPGLPMPQLIEILRQAIPLGLQDLHLTGGEPSLRPDLETLVAFASESGLSTRLITNAAALPLERLRGLGERGLGSIMISVDALEATHDRMRGLPGSYARAMRCARESIELGWRTRVSSVVFRDNLAEILPLARLCSELGVHVFSAFLGSPAGRGSAWWPRMLLAPEWRCFLRDAELAVARGELGSSMELIVEQGFLWQDTQGFQAQNMSGRGAGCAAMASSFDYLVMRADGRLSQCVFLLDDAPALGDLAHEPLQEILERVRREHPNKMLFDIPTPCVGRPCSALCRGGCRGVTHARSGSWTGPDPRCALLDGQNEPIPLCPIAKRNLRTGRIRGSSESALSSKETS